MFGIADPNDLAALASFLVAEGIKVDLNVGGIRIREPEDCADPGVVTFNRDKNLVQKWLNEGGQVHSITSDHGVSNTWSDVLKNESLCQGAEHEDPLWWAARLAEGFVEWSDWFDNMGMPVEEIGIWEGAAAFQTTDPDPQYGVWEAKGVFPTGEDGVDLADLADVIIDTLAASPSSAELGRFNIDHDAVGVETDDGQNDDQWEFRRIIAIEEIMRAKGLRVGISNHLGRELRNLWKCVDCTGQGGCPAEGGQCMLFENDGVTLLKNPCGIYAEALQQCLCSRSNLLLRRRCRNRIGDRPTLRRGVPDGRRQSRSLPGVQLALLSAIHRPGDRRPLGSRHLQDDARGHLPAVGGRAVFRR